MQQPRELQRGLVVIVETAGLAGAYLQLRVAFVNFLSLVAAKQLRSLSAHLPTYLKDTVSLFSAPVIKPFWRLKPDLLEVCP